MEESNNSKRFSKWIAVQAYKHDGLLHRQWSPAYLVKETDEYWAVASKASFVTESDGREWMTKEHAIFFLYKHRWMNVIAMMKENGITYYVNVASPTILDNGFLRYIDYDLDVKLFPDGGKKVLDEEEFQRHVQTYGYSKTLIEAITSSQQEIIKDMDERKSPFVDSLVMKLFGEFISQNKPVPPKTVAK